MASLFTPATEEWHPGVGPKTRGGVEIFARLAPATVVVRTDSGHGTGFFVSADGFLVTNHHVIASGLIFDPKTRASIARVHLGRMAKDGSISLLPDAVDAVFYGADRRRDLALLKLVAVPPALAPLPFIGLSDQPPRPGQAISIIGHPRAGLLWTFRSCQVAAIGQYPVDLVDVVAQLLAANATSRHEIEEGLAAIPPRRIVVSSCEANPGDSGGPLVDESGKLLAVTFAVPSKAELSKFTYHIHLDEVRAFLGQRPATPSVYAPDPWALGPRVELIDLAGEGRPHLLQAGSAELAEQFLFDLDGDTDAGLLRAGNMQALVGERKFDAEFAMVSSDRRLTAFYDTDNDGTFDLAVVSKQGSDRVAELVLTRTRDGGWEGRAARSDERVLDPGRFADQVLGRRLATYLAKLGVQ